MSFDAPAPQSMVRRAAQKIQELNRALNVFRAAMPGIKGVVLAMEDGAPLAYDLPIGIDPMDAASRAAGEYRRSLEQAHARGGDEPASAFVELEEGGRVLVVFLGNGFLLGAQLEADADGDLVEWSAFDIGDSLMSIMRN